MDRSAESVVACASNPVTRFQPAKDSRRHDHQAEPAPSGSLQDRRRHNHAHSRRSVRADVDRAPAVLDRESGDVIAEYLRELLKNARVVRYLTQKHREVLTEFQRIVDSTALEA